MEFQQGFERCSHGLVFETSTVPVEPTVLEEEQVLTRLKQLDMKWNLLVQVITPTSDK